MLATPFAATARAQDKALRQVAPEIFVREGLDEEASPGNDNALANLVAIVGGTCVAVIDTGGCVADGERFKEAIERQTRKPIRFVIYTHCHPDHIFGAQAFVRPGVEFLAHAAFPQALNDRGEYYQQSLAGALGHAAGPLVPPQRLVAGRDEIDLGNRRLLLTAFPTAHSSCDLTIQDSKTRTLIAGDLIFIRRVPSLDGSIKGWLAALEQLKASAATRVVPGHGPPSSSPSGAQDLERYLRLLQSETREAIRHGMEIDAAVKSVGQSERSRWTLFDQYHGHNVIRAYKEIEWE